MWKYFKYNNCFLNFDLNNEKFWYSDLNNVFLEEKISRSAIKSRFKKLNARMEFEEDLVIESLNQVPSFCQIHKKDKILILDLKYNVDSDTFAFQWELQPADDKIKDMLVNPLLLAINSLNSQNEELLNLVKRKDNEIEQYKIEGAILKRRLIATKKFKKSDFDCKYTNVNIDGFIAYSDSNLDALKESCKNFVRQTENNNENYRRDKEIDEMEKKDGRSRKKKALEYRRKQHLEKVKNVGQKSVYDDEDDNTGSVN